MAIDLNKIKEVVIKKKGFKIPTFNDSDEDVKEYDEMMMLMLAGIL